jgi:hypothetical protein
LNIAEPATPTPSSRRNAKGKDKEVVDLIPDDKEVIYISSDEEPSR